MCTGATAAQSSSALYLRARYNVDKIDPDKDENDVRVIVNPIGLNYKTYLNGTVNNDYWYDWTCSSYLGCVRYHSVDEYPSSKDVNDLDIGRVKMGGISDWSGWSNLPQSSFAGAILTFQHLLAQGQKWQLAKVHDKNAIYIRNHYNGTWNGWERISGISSGTGWRRFGQVVTINHSLNVTCGSTPTTIMTGLPSSIYGATDINTYTIAFNSTIKLGFAGLTLKNNSDGSAYITCEAYNNQGVVVTSGTVAIKISWTYIASGSSPL